MLQWWTAYGFNPRTRTGCDGFSWKWAPARQVSIHAPARGATSQLPKSFKTWIVSIHAPARGATTSFSSLSSNPKVSIHAPARGATFLDARMTRQTVFQSTHPHGVRRNSTGNRRVGGRFNPRTRTGCDYQTGRNSAAKSCFNPRTRTGCDSTS